MSIRNKCLIIAGFFAIVVSSGNADGILNVGGGNISGAFTAGDLLVANGAGQVVDGSTVSPMNAPSGINFISNISFSGAFSTSQTWLLINGKTISGTATQGGNGFIAPNQIYIGSDTVDTTTNGNGVLIDFLVEGAPTANFTGGRTAIKGYQAVVGTPAAALLGAGLVGVEGRTRISANLTGTGAGGLYANYSGTAFGMNPVIQLTTTATFLSFAVGQETDVEVQSGASVANKYGMLVVQTAADATRGTFDDAGIVFNNQSGASTTWLRGISFGSNNALWPFGTDSTLIGAQVRVQGGASSPVALFGIDLSAVTFQAGGAAFKSTGFSVNPSGNVAAAFLGVIGTTCVAASTGIYEVVAGELGICDNGTAVAAFNGSGGTFFNRTSKINTNDLLSASVGNTADASFTFQNLNAGSTTAQTAIYLGNSTSSSEVKLILNGAAFSGGLGANAFAINALGGVWLQGNGTTGIQIDTSGNVFLTTAASDSGATDATVCRRTSNGQLLAGSGAAGICLGTSSARFKHGISDIAVGLNEIMGLHPVQYYLNADHGDPDKLLYGFIAEEGLNALPKLVGFDEEWRPNTFDYMGVMAPLVKAFQEHEARLALLEAKVH